MNFFRVLLAAMAVLFGAVSAHSQAVPGQGTWETTLQARDIGNTGTTNAFYDTALNITWLRDANVNGLMDWTTANNWANNLTVGGIGGWRLAAYTPTGSNDALWNVSPASSEVAHLFFSTLGNKSRFDSSWTLQENYGMVNTAAFQNLSTSSGYWLGGWNSTDVAMYFLGDGLQIGAHKTQLESAMAVHAGDVAAVPEPETYAMLLAGLCAIGVIRRHRRST